jgi:sugar O-acyltransferase (sialic acid O-acetyltransferase NeuD family)
MPKLVIYGASNPTIIKLINTINKNELTWEIVGFLDDVKKDIEDFFMEFPILGGDDKILSYHKKGCYFINNVFGDVNNRIIVNKKLDKVRVKYASLVSPSVDHSFVEIGHDCTVMDGVTLGANIVIKDHVAIRYNCSINHDCFIDKFVFIGPGSIICGRVSIGEGVYIGAGVVIKEGVIIHSWSRIGMGAIVNRDVKERDIVAVPPARSIKRLIEI